RHDADAEHDQDERAQELGGRLARSALQHSVSRPAIILTPNAEMSFNARPATAADAEDIACIYNAGIQDRVGTFETRERTPADVRRWFDGGIAEFSVYVDREVRGRGVGRIAMDAIIDAARGAGYWKLVSRVFVENMASRALLSKVGFRVCGIYRRYGRLDGAWRDVVIVERL